MDSRSANPSRSALRAEPQSSFGFRRWAVEVVRELERLRPGVYHTARGESRVLLSFAGRMVTVEQDGPSVWLTFDGADAPPAVVVPVRDRATAVATAARLADFFGR